MRLLADDQAVNGDELDHAAPTPDSDAEQGWHILLVDDDEEQRNLIERLLERSGTAFRLEWMPSLESGLQRLNEARFDVLLLDYVVGPRSGLELLREARARGHELPIIVLTDDQDPAVDDTVARAGATADLAKGTLDSAALERAIRFAIEGSRAARELALRARQQSAVAELGIRALSAHCLDELFQDALRTAIAVCGLELGALYELSSSDDHLALRAAIGFELDDAAADPLSSHGPSETAFALRAEAPVVIEELGADGRFEPQPLWLRHGARSGLSVVLHGPQRPLGLLSVYGRDRRVLAPSDISSVQAIAQLLAGAIERHGSELLMRAVFDSALDGMLIYDDDAVVHDANPAACQLIGLPRAQLIGRSCRDFFRPAGDGAATARTPCARTGGLRGEYLLRRADCSETLIECAAAPSSRPGQHIALFHDISERKQAESALRRRDANLRALLEGLPDAVVVSRAGRVVYVNPSFVRLLGYDADRAVLGRGLGELFALTATDGAGDWLRSVPEGSSISLEREGLRRDGSRVSFEVNVLGVVFEEAPCLLAVARDVTERKRFIRALQRSETNFRYLIENAPDAILAVRDERAVYVNDRFVRLLGYDRRADLLGKNPFEDLVPPEDRARLEASFGSSDPVEHRLLGRGQRVLTVESTSLEVIFDNRPTRILIARDITERRQLESRLILADRMVSMGTLAAAAAHELDQPLASMMGHVNRMTEELTVAGFLPAERVAALREMMGDVAEDCERIRHIVRDVKASARGDDDRQQPAEPRTPLMPAPARRRGRVLVIDDDVGIGKALRRALRREHDVVVFQRAREALELLGRGEPFDVIFCDVMMPEISGIDFFQEIRRRLPKLAGRTVFLTGGGGFTNETLADLRSTRLIEKPFDINLVRAVVREHIGRAPVRDAAAGQP